MFIIGVRGIRRVEQSGTFHCPTCGPGAPFERSVVRGWFTIFFVPCIPLPTREGELVQCKQCGGTFKPEVLEWNGHVPGSTPPPLPPPQEEIHQLRPSVHPKTGLPLPPPLPPKQLGAGTTITYQSNGMATASMVLGILGVVTSFLFVPGYLFGTLALIFGFLALRRVKKGNGLTGGKNAARAGIACSLVALAISVALTAIIATHQPTASDKTRDRMNAAVNELLRTKTIRAHGNNGEALRLANLYAETITGLDAASFTSTDEGPRPFYTVHCERQGDKCAFVVYVPEYRNFEKDAKQLLEDLAWVATRHLPINPDGKSGTPLCVVLRGGVLTGAVMVGKTGTEKPDSTSKNDKFLEPFFAVAPAAPPPPLTPGASDPSQVE